MFRRLWTPCALALLLTCGCTLTLDFDAVSREEIPSDELISKDGWMATASNTLDTSSPAFAIDGLASTNWTTGQQQSPGMWLAVDFGVNLTFRIIQVDTLSERQDACQKVDVYTGDGKDQWTRVRADVPGDPELRIVFDPPVEAHAIKLILPLDVSSDRWWRVDELQLEK
jgi:hypothetical protein